MKGQIAAHTNSEKANRQAPSQVRPSPMAPVTLFRRATDRWSSPDTSSVLDVVGNGGGQPLKTELQADMESRLGSDFSHVRVHTNAKAAESAAAVSAKAYTVGDEIVFGRGSFAPNHHEGKHRLVHELIHVQQQRKGPVAATDLHRGVAVSDPSDPFEREAEAKASAVMSGSMPTAVGAVTSSGERAGQLSRPAGSSARATVQRDEVTESFERAVQREPRHSPAWNAYFQAALQGAPGTPKQKAERAKAMADVAEHIATRRGKVLGTLVPTLPKHEGMVLQVAFVTGAGLTGAMSSWAASFSSALQGAAGEKGSVWRVVERAAQTADQAVLVMGDVPKDLWQKYMNALKAADVR